MFCSFILESPSQCSNEVYTLLFPTGAKMGLSFASPAICEVLPLSLIKLCPEYHAQFVPTCSLDVEENHSSLPADALTSFYLFDDIPISTPNEKGNNFNAVAVHVKSRRRQ